MPSLLLSMTLGGRPEMRSPPISARINPSDYAKQFRKRHRRIIRPIQFNAMLHVQHMHDFPAVVF